MLKEVVEFQIKYSKILFVLLLFFIGFAAYIGSDLKIDPAFKRLVLEDSEYNTNERYLRNAYSQNDAVLVFLNLDRNSFLDNRVKSMDDGRVSIYLDELRDSFEQSSYVVGISSPLYSEDNEYVQFVLSLDVPDTIGSFEGVLDELNLIESEVGEPVGVTTTITGLPVLLDKISTLLIGDSLRTILITLIFVFLILYWYSRDLVFTFVTISTPIVSLIFLAALMVVLGINVTITLAAIGVFILGLGADYAIHISTHYSKQVKELKSHKKALLATIEELRLPITASFLTTLGGFVALIFGVSPSSQDQGKVLAFGIAIIFSVSFILFPILITLFFRKMDVKENKIFDYILNALTKLAIYQTKHAKSVIFLVLILTLVMFFGLTQVKFSTSNSNWIPEDDPISKSFDELNYAYGNTDVIRVVLISESGDLRNSQVVRDVGRLVSLIETIPNVDGVSSPFDSLSYDTIEIFEKITNQREFMFNRDFTLSVIEIYSQNLDEDDSGKSQVLKELREVIEISPIYNTKTSLHGDVVRFDELGNSLEQDAMVTTIYGLGLVFFIASTLYASLSIGFMALIPIILAVIWAIGLMGYFNIPFTSLSTGIISLVLGVGVDFSIHLVDGIRRELKKFGDMEVAITNTLSVSGKAIFLSSITTFIGFLALTFANLLGTQRLGWSLAFAIVGVFFVSILLVPSMISIIYAKDYKNVNKNRIKN